MGSHTLLHCVRRLVFLKPGSGFLLKRKHPTSVDAAAGFLSWLLQLVRASHLCFFRCNVDRKISIEKKAGFQTCSFSTVFSGKINNINKKKNHWFSCSFPTFFFSVWLSRFKSSNNKNDCMKRLSSVGGHYREFTGIKTKSF